MVQNDKFITALLAFGLPIVIILFIIYLNQIIKGIKMIKFGKDICFFAENELQKSKK